METLGPLPAFLRLWVEFLFIRLVRRHSLLFLLTPSLKLKLKCGISRPAVVSYVSLAFGRYVVEPFFAPCLAPVALIKIVSVLGVSEWLLNLPPCTPALPARRPRAPL